MANGKKTASIVGTNHRIQFKRGDSGPNWRKKIQEFEDHIVEVAGKHSVDYIVEEYSEQALTDNNATGSTVRDAAVRAKIPHKFVDPTDEERDEARIKTPAQREAEWLKRLNSTGSKLPLIVCGDEHVQSFANLLKASGYSTVIVSTGWGKGWELID